MRFFKSIGSTGLFAITLLTGCGGNKTSLIVPDPSATIGLPTPAAAGPVNTYTGAQSPGEWTLTLDNTNGKFSYQPVTYPATATSGTITTSNGFTVLSTGGLALEVEGRATILRPGSVTEPVVFTVPQTECYPITGRVRFQYLAMPVSPARGIGSSAGPTVGYGGISASTDSTGSSWQFADMEGNVVSGPTSFTGTCSISNGEAAISFTGQQSILDDNWGTITTTLPTSAQSNIWVGPSGFFVADQSDPSLSTYGASVVGVAEPSSAMTTKNVASKSYLGFLYETATIASTSYNVAADANTVPVSFEPSSTSGSTSITGGEFPSSTQFPGGDVTQTPNSDTIINLGTQSATYNGLYPSVSITVLDPAQNCANYQGNGKTATSEINSDGYVTCTFAGVAVAGNPENKYALFISAYNWAARLGGAPMQIYLFQQ
jgi:hypothetical protein